MKKQLLAFFLFMIALEASAQKEAFDIVSYNAPDGWKKETAADYVSYSKIDARNWGQIAIYKSRISKGDIDSDLQSEWDALVAAQRTITNDTKTQAVKVNDWTAISRSGTWKYNGTDVATILTTFSNGKSCISFLCNATAESYFTEFQKVIASVVLSSPLQNETSNPAAANTSNSNPSTIVGLWCNYHTESYGIMNGIPMLTGGYFRSEYIFYGDGTYLYRTKNWSTSIKEILFIYESGTYSIKGNKLTITPSRGKGEWWSKPASGRTDEWGRRQKTYTHKLEKIAYTFELKYLSGMDNAYLMLTYNKPTVREGRQSNQDDIRHEFSYGRRELSKSLIDNPPGTKTGFEGKQ